MNRKTYLVLILALLLPVCLFSKELYSDAGFYVDIPELWQMTDGDGNTKVEFTSPDGRALFQINVFPGTYAKDAKTFAKQMQQKLKARGDSESYIVSNRDAVLSDFTFSNGEEDVRGYFIFINGGLTLDGKSESDYVIFAYTTLPYYEAYHDFLLSCLDSFSLDERERFCSGPISQYFYNPQTDPEIREVNFNGIKLQVEYDSAFADASQVLVEREARILEEYTKAPEAAKDAWCRFYRMIYRDNYRFLSKFSFAIKNAIDTLYSQEQGLLSLAESDYFAAKLLKYTQGFKYTRNTEGADVVNPYTAGILQTGDCDSRALFMNIILHKANIDSILMVSSVYSHALCAIDVKGSGARFVFDSKKWLVAETTASVSLGLIDQKMSAMDNWIGVSFGF